MNNKVFYLSNKYISRNISEIGKYELEIDLCVLTYYQEGEVRF